MGKGGVGKSSTVNSLIGERVVAVSAFQSEVPRPVMVSRSRSGFTLNIIDTPGLIEGGYVNEQALDTIKRFLLNRTIDVLLSVDRLDAYRVDNLDRQIIKAISDSFGNRIWCRGLVVLTHAQLSPPDGLNYDDFLSKRSVALLKIVRTGARFRKQDIQGVSVLNHGLLNLKGLPSAIASSIVALPSGSGPLRRSRNGISTQQLFLGFFAKQIPISLSQAILVPLPSIAFYLVFLHHFNISKSTTAKATYGSTGVDGTLHVLWTCSFNHPHLLAVLLFFINVDILFWLISLIQSSHWVLMMGVCLPMYAIHSVEKPWNTWDTIATIICSCGIALAYFADTQLHEFVSRNIILKEQGKPTEIVLKKGLWQYHHNYFGEQLWWWGLAVFGWNVGYGWTFIGSLVNSLCLAYVVGLVEQRMLQHDLRANEYIAYQKTTSVWIPWFKLSFKGENVKNT
ncbi:hypothetical protein IFM89_013802 [Coptis chinensis]|uniref:AIG1-type G domain-containing protein n=1 Tax=Coptis chinensis TaxID=261450 RepID=A0A835LMX3_9MAGN|nr:hypothetical protein IFM89_013802 [Coptis chinensis]